MTARTERHEHQLPRGRIIRAAIAVVVTAAVILFLLWLGNFAPAFRSILRGAGWAVLVLGLYWLYRAVRPRTHGDRRDGDRRDHRRRTNDPPLPHCEIPSEPRAPGETRRGA